MKLKTAPQAAKHRMSSSQPRSGTLRNLMQTAVRNYLTSVTLLQQSPPMTASVTCKLQIVSIVLTAMTI